MRLQGAEVDVGRTSPSQKPKTKRNKTMSRYATYTVTLECEEPPPEQPMSNPLQGWRFSVDDTNPHEAVATIRRDRNEHMPLVPSYDVNGTITATGRDSATAVERLAQLVTQ